MGALLKGPIDEISNQDRLKAQIVLSPWYKKPDALIRGPKRTESSLQSDVDDIEEDYAYAQFSGVYEFARIVIENNGSKNVADISFRMKSEEEKSFVDTIITGEKYLSSAENVTRVSIPDMKPGDRVTVYVWGIFSTHSAIDDFTSYSSEGEFIANFEWPQSEELIYGSWISRILDEYAWPTFATTIVVLMIGLSILASLYHDYIRLLFTHNKVYKLERARFIQNPKKFSPDFELSNHRHYQTHAIFGSGDEETESDEAST